MNKRIRKKKMKYPIRKTMSMKATLITSNLTNTTRPRIYDVIWWNKPLIIMAIRKIIESDMNGIPYDSIPILRVLDIHPWDETLRIFKRNYTEDLKYKQSRGLPGIIYNHY